MALPIAPIGTIAPVSTVGGAAAAGNVISAGQSASSASFASALADGLDAVQGAQTQANQLAVQAATGHLVDPAQLTIATTKAQLMTQMATTIQSKAVTAFNTIMSMQA